jgi:hypothetical protein
LKFTPLVARRKIHHTHNDNFASYTTAWMRLRKVCFSKQTADFYTMMFRRENQVKTITMKFEPDKLFEQERYFHKLLETAI